MITPPTTITDTKTPVPAKSYNKNLEPKSYSYTAEYYQKDSRIPNNCIIDDSDKCLKEEKPLVSIFLPFYNDKKFLASAIAACLEQTFSNWELFLFDHASTDGSDKIAKSFLEDKRIKYYRASENLGAGSGLNLQFCLPKIRGKYLKLLCADDVMTTNCLEECFRFLELNPSIDFCFSDMQFIDERGKEIPITWSQEREGVDFNNDEKKTLKILFQGKGHLAYPTSFLKTTIIRGMSLNSTFIMVFDIWLWATLLIQGKKIGFIPKSLINYRCHKGQISSADHLALAQRRSFFENSVLTEIYFNIKDVELTKYLLNSDFARKLENEDQDLIPFVFAHHYFTSGESPFNLVGYKKISSLLEDADTRRKIQTKFGYTIRHFRNEYSYPNVRNNYENNKRVLNDFRNKANGLSGSELTLGMLVFLMIKKFYKATFSRIIKRKKYTI